MDRMIYLSMSGAKAAMQRQESLANNLANVSTPGFRAELQAFRAVPVQGSGASTRVFTLETTIGHSDAPGQVTATGRALDVAVKGESWLAVQALDGTEAYTRAGSLDLSADGLFRTAGGEALDADALARVQEGALEGSNVSAVESMVEMIAAARQFEAQMKLLQTAEADEKAASQLLSF